MIVTYMRGIVLFDIDGTLIRRAGPHHREALVEAVYRVTGIHTSIDHIPVQGMLDRDIINQMLRDAGAAADVSRRSMPAIVREAQELYNAKCVDLTGCRCPGVVEVLQRLAEASVAAGLVTGNLSGIAWRKMEAAGIRPYFQFGAFAEMGESRAELVRIAIGIARDNGWLTDGDRVCLVGDHPNDVDAAQRNAIRSVAVCTGVVPKVELQACGPDLVVDDLTNIGVAELLF